MGWPITAADVRDELKWAPAQADDDELEKYALGATRRIEKEIGQRCGQTVTAHADGPCTVVRFDWPVEALTSVNVDGTAVDLARFRLDGPAGLLHGRFAGRQVVATATAPTAVDEQIELAARYLAATWVKQSKVGPPSRSSKGQEPDTDVLQGFAMPRRVSEMIRPDVVVGGFS